MKTKSQILQDLRAELALYNLTDESAPIPISDIVIGPKGEITAIIFTPDPISLNELSSILQATGRVSWVSLRTFRKDSQ